MAEDLIHELQMTDFQPQPQRLLIGVVDSVPNAEATIRDLLQSGAPKDHIHTWVADDGVRAMDPEGEAHGLMAWMWRQAQRATGEHRRLARYAEELEHGHVCVGVDVESVEQATTASQIFDRHGAHFVHVLGLGAIETVKP